MPRGANPPELLMRNRECVLPLVASAGTEKVRLQFPWISIIRILQGGVGVTISIELDIPEASTMILLSGQDDPDELVQPGVAILLSNNH